MNTHIIGVGGYLPEHIMTNDDLAKVVDTSDDWIRERTGITQRHIIAKDEYTSDLATRAGAQALEDAGISIDDIDAIVVATTTPDMIFPSTASMVQHKLGGKGFPAWDIQAVCSGFVYGLAQVDGMMRGGMFKRVLLIGAESMSRILDWQDRNTCVLFGDGAGAVVLEASDKPGILSTHIHADGRYEHLLRVPRGVSTPKNHYEAEQPFIEMKGNEVFKMAVTTLGRIVDETLAANNMEKSDIDWLIPHQANIRIITATAKKLKMSMEKVIVTVTEHGNTSAASVPLALDHAVRNGQVKRGETLLLEAFGGGFTWGSVLVKY